jgi:predicted RNA-binding protein (virulence factor B family)
MFLVYRGWAGTVGGRIYNTQRIWGKMNPSTGIEESPKPQASDHNLQATVLRRLPAGSVAFDAMGRRAVNPKSGVYFVRDEGRGAKDVGRTRKVVIQR